MATSIFTLASDARLALASTSPRRRKLLDYLGLPFVCIEPRGGEPSPEPGESPGDYALRCAIRKNVSCRFALREPAVILSADTVVSIDDVTLGKPRDKKSAFEMLVRLNGREHLVFTSFYMHLPDGAETSRICKAHVKFRKWPEDVLKAYAESGECLDKAGGYAIQSKGVFLTESIDGSWTTVMGLPMAEVTAALLDYGVMRPTL